jgi:hypothetical protein
MAIATGTAILGAAALGGAASIAGARSQSRAARRAADLQQQQFQQQVELQEPWRKAGEQALNKLVPLATEYTPFGTQQFQADPGYGFRMAEGMKALERSAAARGGLLSGGTLRGVQRFGQDLASQEYQNAFNRYQAERTARLGPLQSLAGVGQTTAQQLGSAGQQMASNVGEAMTSGAAARASGYVGGANALTGALGSYLNYSQGQNLLNRLQPQIAGAPGYSYQPTQMGPGDYPSYSSGMA